MKERAHYSQVRTLREHTKFWCGQKFDRFFGSAEETERRCWTVSKPGGRENSGSGMPSPHRSGSKKLYACANKTCPNQSHYTLSCPNSAGKEPHPKFAVAGVPLPELSREAPADAHTRNGVFSGVPGKQPSRSVGGTFHRAAAALGKTGRSPTVFPEGPITWKSTSGEPHRDDDLPAVIYTAGGGEEWHLGGKLHRDNGLPAVIYSDGSKYWYLYGKLHRDNDLPARVLASGIQEWRQHDKMHRVLGPAFLRPDGYQEWWFRGEQTEHPDLCEQACSPAQTEQEKEQLVLLCLHDDPVVAAVAAHNPDCPEEGVAAHYLKHA